MKKVILFVLIITSCNKPTAKEILQKSYKKCQSIKTGYYKLDYSWKPGPQKDTIYEYFKCSFKKKPTDSIFSAAFSYQYFNHNQYVRNVLYTENNLVEYVLKNSKYPDKDGKGIITSKKLWSKHLKATSHKKNGLYLPILGNRTNPFPVGEDYNNPNYIFKLIGEAFVDGTKCYHIKMNKLGEKGSQFVKIKGDESNFWISKDNYLPIQYTHKYDMVMNNNQMTQFKKYKLVEYNFDKEPNENELKLNSIPSYVKIMDYQPQQKEKTNNLLNKGSLAPNWSLTSLDGKQIQLNQLKQKVVLIDFFYKGCYPCMLSYPSLERLHKKYKDKGLSVIGINPTDTKEEEKEELKQFLLKQGVTYTIVLDKIGVAKKYSVFGYPTVFLINKKGEIITIEKGYNENMEEKLEKLIKQHLTK